MLQLPDREAYIALALIPKFNSSIANRMEARGLTPQDFLFMPRAELSKTLNYDPKKLPDDATRQEAMAKAHRVIADYDNYNIRILYINQPDYPKRLRENEDPPPILFQLGEASLDATMVVSVVGTRTPTAYGVNICKKLVEGLTEYFPDILIVSGLAYGIDACAHTVAIERKCPTVAVLAHGLHKVYPAAHRDLAARMVRTNGALISQYPLGEDVYRQRFLERNQIVAGLADVTVVVESPMKGGAMSTAAAAFTNNREVMAFPGRVNDEKSGGCNLLIRKEKAHLITCAADLVELMGWRPEEGISIPITRSLFPELEGDSKTVYDILQGEHNPIHLDMIHVRTQLPIGRIIAALSELEYDGIVLRHPGNHYSIS